MKTSRLFCGFTLEELGRADERLLEIEGLDTTSDCDAQNVLATTYYRPRKKVFPEVKTG